MMQTIRGRIFTDKMCFEPGEIVIDGERIERITLCADTELTPKEAETYLLPGLVDIHLHGCAGYDFCDGTKEAFRAIASYEMAHGVTTICPATMTLPEDALANICRTCADAVETEVLESGILLGEVIKGIYLEGPFISPEKRGAQNPAFIRAADEKMLKRLQRAAGGLIKIVAAAPEAEGAMACIRACRDMFRFSIAHTCADYETAREAIQAGAAHITHLYNAMPPFTHRQPGVIGAAADEEQTMAELICDGVHIHPSVVRSTFQWFGAQRMVLISDSMMAAGMEDGEYALGGQPVRVKGNLALLSDGTIAGSVTNLYDCMRMAVQMGVPKEDALRAASYNPAVAVGLENECGSLRAGKKADILITDEKFVLRGVIKGGRKLA
ncbi:MAG: N-acetylglucosamine-6-phosphate deacetylase [Bacillus sp. (in: Bacteria)]|nr:N-acetylglucosamine-6-phosphate deacetylase [Bacillus sp. (in: firmicutes)]MCM1426526.1 N-acetylglucosamine-6-phosphate deacetylase [Eubacterium sp.]